MAGIHIRTIHFRLAHSGTTSFFGSPLAKRSGMIRYKTSGSMETFRTDESFAFFYLIRDDRLFPVLVS